MSDKKRLAARAEFANTAFQNDDPIGSFGRLREAALNRFFVEFDWYDRAAAKRRWASIAIRVAALALIAVGGVILDLAAFKSSAAAGIVGFLGFEPEVDVAGISTLFFFLAGIVFLLDRTFLVTKNLIRYRVTEYQLRAESASFEAKFDKALSDAEVLTATLFDQLRSLASETYEDVLEAIKNETSAWGDDLKAAVEALRKRVEGDESAGRKRTHEAIKKTEEAAKYARPAGLTITIDKKQGRAAPLSIAIEGPTADSAEDISPGSTRGFSLLPGLYVATLFDSGGARIASKTKRLKPATDETLSI